jgi:hypothetical protein
LTFTSLDSTPVIHFASKGINGFPLFEDIPGEITSLRHSPTKAVKQPRLTVYENPKKNPNVELTAPGFEPTTSQVASRLSTWMQIPLKISEFEKIMITLQTKSKSGLKLNPIVKCRVFI